MGTSEMTQPTTTQAEATPPPLEPLIYDLGAPGRTGVTLPQVDVPEAPLPEDLLRSDLDLPEVSEMDVVRHFVRLSQLNHSIDTGFYPLGSCTRSEERRVGKEWRCR